MGTDNNGLKSFTDLVAHLNKASKEAESPRRQKGPRQKKIVDSDRWTKLVHPETIRPVEPPRQPVLYTELPAQMRVSQLPLRLFCDQWKGRLQWHGQYRLYHKGDHLDHIKVVVNIPRRFEWLVEGGWYWVRPTTMAPKTRLVFAELIREVDHRRDFGSESSLNQAVTDDESSEADYWDDYEGSHEALEDEIRANSELPDYGDYDY